MGRSTTGLFGRAAKRSGVTSAFGVCLLMATSAPTRSEEHGSPPTCVLSRQDIGWLHAVGEAWESVAAPSLHIDPDPFPWVVLFDASCTWHLAPREEPPGAKASETTIRVGGESVPLLAVAHGGSVELPNGASIPPTIIAAAMPYRSGDDAFLVLALPEVWASDPRSSGDPHLELRIRSVALHEMIHTRQLPTLRRHIDELGKQYRLPPRFDDDVVERRFDTVPGYRTAYERERNLLYQAVAEPVEARRDSLISVALDAAGRRRERFFQGDDAVYAHLETLFLNMEGVAEWVRFKFHQADPDWPREPAEILAFLRGGNNSWSQDEGLALYVLLDATGIEWQEATLGFAMASPFELLARARRIERLHPSTPSNPSE